MGPSELGEKVSAVPSKREDEERARRRFQEGGVRPPRGKRKKGTRAEIGKRKRDIFLRRRGPRNFGGPLPLSGPVFMFCTICEKNPKEKEEKMGRCKRKISAALHSRRKRERGGERERQREREPTDDLAAK